MTAELTKDDHVRLQKLIEQVKAQEVARELERAQDPDRVLQKQREVRQKKHASTDDISPLLGSSTSVQPSPSRKSRARTLDDIFAPLRSRRGEEEPDNPIRDAMRRAGLRPAAYAVARSDQELSARERAQLATSEQRVLQREGYVKPYDPDLLRALLKWHMSNVAKKRKIFDDFFQQWPVEDLQLLYRLYDNAAKGSSHKSAAAVAEKREHTFFSQFQQWYDLLRTNPYSVAILSDVIEKKLRGEEPPDKDILWWVLVDEYKHKVLSQEATNS